MTQTPAQKALRQYEAEMCVIRLGYPIWSKEFASAASAACARYEAKMVKDIGPAKAKKLGAGRK